MNILPKIKIVFFICLLFFNYQLFGQDKRIDSLENLKNQHIQNDTVRVNLLNELAYLIWSIEHDKASKYTAEAFKIAEQINYTKGKAESFRLMGILSSNYFKELFYYQQALSLFEKINNHLGIARCLNNIGVTYTSLNNYNKSLEYFFKGIPIAEKLKNPFLLGGFYCNIGDTYQKLNNFKSALDYLSKANQIAEQNKLKSLLSIIYLTTGDVFKKLQNYDKAIEYFEKALVIIEELKIKYYLGRINLNLSEIYFKQMNYNAALIYANKVLTMPKEYIDSDINNKVHLLLSNIYAETKNYKQAFEFQKKHQRLNDSIFNNENQKKITNLELAFKFEKEKLASDLIQQKKEAIQAEEQKRQDMLLVSFVVGFILMFLLATISFRSYLNKRKTNKLLLLKKQEIEEKNEELIQMNEEIFAQKDEIEKQKNEIEKQKNDLEVKNINLTDSIYYAQKIQEAMLPSEEILSANFNEYFILFKPRDIVSGDFYWFKQIKNFAFIVAADCTGHGVPGAFMSMLGIAQLNEIVTKRDVNPPNEILNELRKRIKKSFYHAGKIEETQDGMDIAFCVIDLENNTLQFAGAFNPMYLIRQNKDNQVFEFKEIKADRMPIGAHPKDNLDFTNHELQLSDGDTFYIFSDGYVSQFGGVNFEKFRTKRLQDLLLKIQNHDMKTQKQIINQVLVDWQGDNEQVDDILIIGIRYRYQA